MQSEEKYFDFNLISNYQYLLHFLYILAPLCWEVLAQDQNCPINFVRE